MVLPRLYTRELIDNKKVIGIYILCCIDVLAGGKANKSKESPGKGPGACS
jgi:hypothetical protein